MPMSCIFEMDVRDFKGNPFKAETPFGPPIIINTGNLAAENDLLREELEHWKGFVSMADKIQFPFEPSK